MNITLIASECDPLVKVGGLGDVVASLSKELLNFGYKPQVIIPFYKTINDKKYKPKFIGKLKVFIDYKDIEFELYKTNIENFDLYLIKEDNFFGRDYVYATSKGGYEDNYLRYAFFSLASLESLKFLREEVDILHVHDWHTSLVPVYKELYFKDFFEKTACVLTIHNIAFQGVFDASIIPIINIPWDLYNVNALEFYSQVNYLKGGIIFSDVITTVSPTHAKEIQDNLGFGLEGVIREKKYVFGILNGIDTEKWNPETDKEIVMNYNSNSFHEAKVINKRAVKELFGLETPIDRPLAVFVARLAKQKGLDLIAKSIKEAIKLGFDFIFLGSGDDYYQNLVMDMVKDNFENVAARIEYNESLWRKLSAGSDIFLMPSEYEPCGIAQMIAMRYGSIPVVHKTGGLADTVISYFDNRAESTGFNFTDYNHKDFLYALSQARIVYETKNCSNKIDWDSLIKRAMEKDFSWKKSVYDYIRVYKIAKLIKL